MPRVNLDDDGVARREGRGGVAARDREGEGEVGGREDRDRAERHEHAAQVGIGGVALESGWSIVASR